MIIKIIKKSLLILILLFIALTVYVNFLDYLRFNFSPDKNEMSTIIKKKKYTFLSFDESSEDKFILISSNKNTNKRCQNPYIFHGNKEKYHYDFCGRVKNTKDKYIEIFYYNNMKNIKVGDNVYKLKPKNYKTRLSSKLLVHSYWKGNYVVTLDYGNLINGKFCYAYLMINNITSKEIKFCYKNLDLLRLEINPLSNRFGARFLRPIILKFKKGYIVYDKLYYRSLMNKGLDSNFFIMDDDFNFIKKIPVSIKRNINNGYTDIKGMTIELSDNGCTIILNNVEKAQITNICNLIQDI